MQIIVKSGGNDYHGSVYGDYEDRALQSFNIDSDQIGRGAQGGPATASARSQPGVERSRSQCGRWGYIARDKAWWYLSFREQNVAARVVNFPVRPLRTELVNYTGKVDGRSSTKKPTRDDSATWERNHQPNRVHPFGPAGSGLTAATAINESDESTSEQLAWGWVWKGEWNRVISHDALVELRAGEFGADRPGKPNGTSPRFEDVKALIVPGGNRDWEAKPPPLPGARVLQLFEGWPLWQSFVQGRRRDLPQHGDGDLEQKLSRRRAARASKRRAH